MNFNDVALEYARKVGLPDGVREIDLEAQFSDTLAMATRFLNSDVTNVTYSMVLLAMKNFRVLFEKEKQLAFWNKAYGHVRKLDWLDDFKFLSYVIMGLRKRLSTRMIEVKAALDEFFKVLRLIREYKPYEGLGQEVLTNAEWASLSSEGREWGLELQRRYSGKR